MNEAASHSYSLGRPLGTIASPFTGEDSSFAGQRLDGQRICQATYRHCTFINASLKEAILADCAFSDCVFVGCYFRRAILRNCRFEGCRFYDCEFPRVSLVGCRFYYVRFAGCQIAFDEMEHSLPSEPNVREELCRNLARQSMLVGLSDDARKYRKLENVARESHLWNGFTSQSGWYRSHFVGWQKFLALRGWIWSKMNGILWGYSDSGIRLAANFLTFTFVVFPLLYLPSGLFRSTNRDALTTFADCVLLSLSTATPADFSHATASYGWLVMLVASVQSLYSVVLVAMFAAFLFQWSSRR